MSTFSCKVVRTEVKSHENADALDIAQVGLFQSIIRKGSFVDGELAVYIPEASICPPEVLKACGLWDDLNQIGKLSGANKDRVKAIKLRGVLSQGILMKIPEGVSWAEGQDVAEELGITKYVPEIPAHFFKNGQPKIAGAFDGFTPKFDVENIKANKNAYELGEEILITEKIHGTCCVIGCFTKSILEQRGLNVDNLYNGQVYVGTKRLTSRGIVFDPNDEGCVYGVVPKEMGLLDWLIEYTQELDTLLRTLIGGVSSVCLIGEIFGQGIQKGFLYGQEGRTFRGFDVWVSMISTPSMFAPVRLKQLPKDKVPWVPVLYEGPYSKELLELNAGMSTFDPKQIREGIVLRNNDGLLMKYVSEAYLTRKGDQTEYE